MKISIIVPVYNVRDYLRECLDSILGQTYTNWEALCIDDGSTDGSSVILDEYCARDARIRVFHKRNGGVSSARNLALVIAQGDYISFLDGDDTIYAEWLDVIAGLIKKYPEVDWIRLEDIHCVNGIQETVYVSPKEIKESFISSDDIMRFGWQQISANGCVSRNVYRRMVIKDTRYQTRLSMREDAIFALTLLQNIKSCVHTNYNGYLYRILSNSAVRKKKSVDASVEFQKALLALWLGYKTELPSIRHCISRFYMELVYKDIRQWFSVRNRDARDDRKRLRDVCKSAWRAGAIRVSIDSFKCSMSLLFFTLTASFYAFLFKYKELFQRSRH